MVTFGGVAASFAACGIGAKGVATAFSTSVGTKAITLREAVVLASILRLQNAALLGGHVIETIPTGIADPACLGNMPAVLMGGMVSPCHVAQRCEVP